MVSICAIEATGRDRRARRLVLSDGEDALITAAAVVRALGLKEGDELEPEQLRESIALHEQECARERALRLLGYRERSCKELEDRLRGDGYPPECVRTIAARMAELDLVNDTRFAQAWARSRTASGIGPRRISSELALRGVSPDVIVAAIDGAIGDSTPAQQARAAIRPGDLEDRHSRDRALRRLVRRGFSLRDARDALEGDS